MLFRNCKVTINAKEFYYASEGSKDLALDVVWEDRNLTKLLFSLMTALDLSDTHMEFLRTSHG